MLTVESIFEISGEPRCGMCGDCCNRDPLGRTVGKYCKFLLGPFCGLRVAGREPPEECVEHECGSREPNPRPLTEDDERVLEKIGNGVPIEEALSGHPGYETAKMFEKIEERLSQYVPGVPHGLKLRELLIRMGIPSSMLQGLGPDELGEITGRVDPDIGKMVREWREMHLKYRTHGYPVPVSASV